jgi:hypothetical protein
VITVSVKRGQMSEKKRNNTFLSTIEVQIYMVISVKNISFVIISLNPIMLPKSLSHEKTYPSSRRRSFDCITISLTLTLINTNLIKYLASS